DGVVGVSFGKFSAECVIRIRGGSGCGGDVSAGAVGIGNRGDATESVIGRVRVNSALRIGSELSLRQAAKAIENVGGDFGLGGIDWFVEGGGKGEGGFLVRDGGRPAVRGGGGGQAPHVVIRESGGEIVGVRGGSKRAGV